MCTECPRVVTSRKGGLLRTLFVKSVMGTFNYSRPVHVKHGDGLEQLCEDTSGPMLK